MRNFAKATLVAAALSFPVAANADTFLAGSYNVIGGQAVVADLNGQIINGLAGQVQLVGAGPNAGTDFLLWCIGITTGISLPYNYTITDIPLGGVANGFPGVQNLDANQVRQIGSLIVLGDNVPGIDKAAVATAIWKAEYGNALSFIGLSPTVTADMNAYLLATLIGGASDCPTCSLKLFTDIPINPSQPFADVNIAAVPVPAVGTGLPGLIAGFMFLARWCRKRREKLVPRSDLAMA
jgi:hypothetical protein